MNLILFEPSETTLPLPSRDPRARHVIDVLGRRTGDSFDAGLVNGPRGKATISAIGEDALSLTFAWETGIPGIEPIALLIGLPRPQTARDILREATALGVSAMHFIAADKGDPNYAQSTLWCSGEWRRQLIAGAEQAFTTRLPDVTHGRLLADVLPALPVDTTRCALDNYESPVALGQWQLPRESSVVLAIGPERGWSARERDLLREHRFGLAHLGSRVLRTETATIAAVAIVRAKLGLT